MRRLLLFASLLLLAACASPAPAAPVEEDEGAVGNFSAPAGAVALTPQSCPAAAAHVYHPQRLHLLAGCSEVTLKGTLRHEKTEPDGDVHVQFQVDPGQKDPLGGSWINAVNSAKPPKGQNGYLVLEPVCENPVTQRDAVSACTIPDPNHPGKTLPYHNPLKLPKVGTHVTVVGYWVFDDKHGWYELHPLTSVSQG